MGPCVSYECSEQDGSHVCEDHFFPEIIDPDTLKPLPYGQTGELVFTTLTKEGMPLLRYRTRDLCTLAEGECACGRTSVKMGRIMGRSDDMLIIRGINVFPSQVESVVLSMPECAPRYLLVVDRVDNLDTLTVQVEMRQEYFAQGFDTFEPIFKLEKELAAKLRSVLSISAKVEVKQPGTLERSQGKSKFVIDKRVLK
jgi:phenylacetate-CoA ligase